MRLAIVLLIGALFFFLQHLLYKKNWYKGLDVNLDFEKHTVREGDQNTLIEVVRNDKFLPLPVVLLKFSITRSFLFPRETNAAVTDQYYRKEYFSLKPYQSVTRKYTFTASRRGEYTVSSVDVIGKDYFFFNAFHFSVGDLEFFTEPFVKVCYDILPVFLAEFHSVKIVFHLSRELHIHDIREIYLQYTYDIKSEFCRL